MNIPALQPKVVASEIAPERLANNPKLTEQQKVGEASRQFESILLKQILDSSQKTVIKSKFNEDSTASGIYHDMVTTRLADSISKSGSFGLAKTFQQQLNRAPSTRPDGLHKQDLKPLHHAPEKPINSTPTHPAHAAGDGTANFAVQRLGAYNSISK